MAAEAPRSTNQDVKIGPGCPLHKSPLTVCYSDQVVDKAQKHVHDMSGGTISDAHNLQKRMRFRNFAFAANTQHGEENDHRAAAGCEPEWTADSVDIAD